jgi:hypothetical protein
MPPDVAQLAANQNYREALRQTYAEQRATRGALRDVYRERKAGRAAYQAARAAAPFTPRTPFTCRTGSACPRSFAEHQAQQAARTPAGGRAWTPIGESNRGEA